VTLEQLQEAVRRYHYLTSLGAADYLEEISEIDGMFRRDGRGVQVKGLQTALSAETREKIAELVAADLRRQMEAAKGTLEQAGVELC
jgi:response regulator of citrate/malate metabolism